MRCSQHLSNNRGFSILQALIASSIAIGGILATSQAIVNQNKIQKINNLGNDFQSSVEIIKKLVANQDVCSCNFQGMTLDTRVTEKSVPPGHNMSLFMWDADCSKKGEVVAQVGAASGIPGIELLSVAIDQLEQVSSSPYFKARVRLKGKVAGSQKLVDDTVTVGLKASSIAGDIAQIEACSENFSLGMPLVSGAGTFNASTVNGLQPGTHYQVLVSGITANKGTGGATLGAVRVTDCDGNLLVRTPSNNINWPDGNVPQSASFVVQAPADGCIRGFTDGNQPAKSMTYFAVASAEHAANMGGISNIAASLDGNRVDGLEGGDAYLVSFYGLAPNKGTGGATLGASVVRDCSGNDLQSIPAQNINWPDGNIPVSAQMMVTVPATGCIEAFVDGDDAAQKISYVRLGT